MNKANKKLPILDVTVTNYISLGKTKNEIRNINAKQFAPSAMPKERQLKGYPRCPICNKKTIKV